MTGLPRLSLSRFRRALMFFPIVLVLLWTGCCAMTERLVTRADRLAARDAETGVLYGAEERWLGPEDSPGVVLFVHGFIGAGNNFNDLPERLAAKGWRVRVMRLPGHGTSPRDMLPVTPEDLQGAVTREVRALRTDYEEVVIVAHSMGGALSVLAAAEEPIDKLVLGAPYFGVTHHWYYLLKPETWAQAAGPFMRWVYKGKIFILVNRKEAKETIVSYAWVPIDGLRKLMEIGRRARDPQLLGRIQCPVLWLHGPGDTAASFQAARRAFDAIGSNEKQAVVLERSNHHIYWDYDSEQVMREVEAFVGVP